MYRKKSDKQHALNEEEDQLSFRFVSSASAEHTVLSVWVPGCPREGHSRRFVASGFRSQSQQSDDNVDSLSKTLSVEYKESCSQSTQLVG